MRWLVLEYVYGFFGCCGVSSARSAFVVVRAGMGWTACTTAQSRFPVDIDIWSLVLRLTAVNVVYCITLV
jgi:hypothetical protein